MPFGRSRRGQETEAVEPDQGGRIPLHYAAMENDAALVGLLISSGQSPNAQDKLGYTPLHFAAQQQSLASAQKLVERGADVNLTDVHGNGPLWTAVFNSKGDGNLILLLRGHGAEALLVNKHGKTPVTLARTIANYDVKQYFTDLE
jgi:ankyrin repeat protein